MGASAVAVAEGKAMVIPPRRAAIAAAAQSPRSRRITSPAGSAAARIAAWVVAIG
jgi:hypothetical protein